MAGRSLVSLRASIIFRRNGPNGRKSEPVPQINEHSLNHEGGACDEVDILRTRDHPCAGCRARISYLEGCSGLMQAMVATGKCSDGDGFKS